jgi:hypothetical protein
LFWNVKLNCALGASVAPKTPLSLVAVCVVESLFVQVTVVPAVTVSGFGLYAVVVSSSAPLTIDTGVPLLEVDGDVGVVVLLLLPPHEATIAAAVRIEASRRELVMPQAKSNAAA